MRNVNAAFFLTVQLFPIASLNTFGQTEPPPNSTEKSEGTEKAIGDSKGQPEKASIAIKRANAMIAKSTAPQKELFPKDLFVVLRKEEREQMRDGSFQMTGTIEVDMGRPIAAYLNATDSQALTDAEKSLEDAKAARDSEVAIFKDRYVRREFPKQKRSLWVGPGGKRFTDAEHEKMQNEKEAPLTRRVEEAEKRVATVRKETEKRAVEAKAANEAVKLEITIGSDLAQSEGMKAKPLQLRGAVLDFETAREAVEPGGQLHIVSMKLQATGFAQSSKDKPKDGN